MLFVVLNNMSTLNKILLTYLLTYQMNGKQNSAEITNNQITDSILTVKQQV